MYRILLLLFATVLINGQSSTDYYTESTTEPASTTQNWRSSSSTTESWYETTTYTPPPDPINTDCTCNFSNIWIDVIFAIDASNAMGNDGMNGAINYLLTSLLPPFPISQYLGQYTRVGFIFYAKDVVIQSNLTTYSSWDQLVDDLDNPGRFLQNTDDTNMEAAIQTASDLLTTNNGGRVNTRKVMVVLASAYRPGGYNAPKQAADTFKENGNKIIAIEYVQTHGIPIPELRNISSPGFFLSSRDQDIGNSDLLYLFCYANCYCSSQLKPYDRMGILDVPTGGCFTQQNLPAAELLAARTCQHGSNYSGILPKILNDDDANFVTSLVANRVQQWIGLTRDYYGAPWKWGDGTLLSGYSIWANGENSKSGNCAIQAVLSGLKPEWFVQNCTTGFVYSCQLAPCSTDNYCADTIGTAVEDKKP